MKKIIAASTILALIFLMVTVIGLLPVLAAEEWILPTDFNDPDSTWSDEPDAYDIIDPPDWRAASTTVALPTKSWSTYLELILPAEYLSSSVRWYASWQGNGISLIDLDYYDGASWQDLYEGSYTHRDWYEEAISPSVSFSQVRVRFWNDSASFPSTPYLYGIEFFGDSPPATPATSAGTIILQLVTPIIIAVVIFISILITIGDPLKALVGSVVGTLAFIIVQQLLSSI